jgi:hypothetical protein
MESEDRKQERAPEELGDALEKELRSDNEPPLAGYWQGDKQNGSEGYPARL